MRFRVFVIRVSILLILILGGILTLKYQVETYNLSAQIVEETFQQIQAQIQSDTVPTVPKDTVNMDSVAHFVDELDSVLTVFQKGYQIPKFSQNSSSTYVRRDPTKKLILVTGDSMCDLLFIALRKLRKENDFEIVYETEYKAIYGSTITHWANKRKKKRKLDLTAYIKKYNPDLIVFSLGSNEILYRVSEKKIKNLRKVLSYLKGREYVWVGPPNWKKDKGLDSILHANVGSSRYFVSKNFDFKRISDGAHPTMSEGKVWVDTLTRWINQNPVYNFKFPNLPPRKAKDFERICRKYNLTARK